VKTNYLTAIATISFFAAAFDASAKDGIKTYSVPKDHPPITKKGDDLAAVDVNSAPIQWKTPAGWRELAPTSIRIGNFLVTDKGEKSAEVVITSFPGSVGTERDNVNRWRGEIGLPPVSDKEISAQGIKINSSDAKLYELAGATAGTTVAVLPRNGATWFFKMRGDKTLVAASKPAFLEFLKSIRFSENAPARKAPAVLEAMADNPHANIAPPSDPHAGIVGAGDPHANLGQAASKPNNDEPLWNIPPSWKEKPQGVMVVKSFSVANKDQNAAVAISVFPGDVGGDFANFNRWRGQMSLAPLSQNEFSKATQPIEVIGGKALLADMIGTDAKTGKPARLVAAIVPHAGRTWFYKLLGDEPVVAIEKENFVKLVQTARY
jgi:hypothetical protein